MTKDNELIAFLAVLVAIVLLGCVAAALAWLQQASAASAVISIDIGLVGALKVPDFKKAGNA